MTNCVLVLGRNLLDHRLDGLDRKMFGSSRSASSLGALESFLIQLKGLRYA